MPRVVCLSDTHTYGRFIQVPEGDILIHAGDHTFRGTQREILSALMWLDSLPHKNKVFIAGNHDFFFWDGAPRTFHGWSLYKHYSKEELLEKFPSLTYLEDSSTVIEGLKIYGSPWQPWFHDWAFNFPEDINSYIAEAHQTWNKIPSDTNILITHGPPLRILDSTTQDIRVGCSVLRRRLQESDLRDNLKLHVFGHIHESAGIYKDEHTRTFVNAAICTLNYEPINTPIVIDL